jgi:hypothetical protein
MTASRTLARLAVVGSAASALASVLAAPAQAAAPVPGCFEVRATTGFYTQTVYVTNRCPNAIGWFVDREGGNTNCYYTAAGASDSVKWRKADAYHGTYLCNS